MNSFVRLVMLAVVFAVCTLGIGSCHKATLQDESHAPHTRPEETTSWKHKLRQRRMAILEYKRPSLVESDESSNNDSTEENTCSEPNISELQENFTNEVHAPHTSHLSLLQRNRNQPITAGELVDDHCREGYPAPYTNHTCSPELLGMATGEINEMSLCPWTYIRHFNSKRYPTTMMFAQCECTQCIEGSRFSVTNNCRPVYAKVKVLIRGDECHMGKYWYSPTYEKVPVACVCTRPNE